MLDRTLAIVAIVALVVFVGILIAFVQSPSLIIVVLIGIGLASYDFFRTAFLKGNGDGDK